MIKVMKKPNKYMMEIFHKKIILLIFKWLEKSFNPVQSIKSFDKSKKFSHDEIDILKIIFRKTTLKTHLNNILSSLIRNGNKNSELKKIKRIYSYQRRQIQKGNYSLKPININNILIEELFTFYFFEKLFKDKDLWITISQKDFSKDILKKNFKLTICPYCNTTSSVDMFNYQIDHFLPKSLFPLLSMYYLNLIPICPSCNSTHNGKGANIKSPIDSQFTREIGNSIQFDMNSKTKSINLTSVDINIKNFIDLLQLKNKYSSIDIYEDLNKELRSFQKELSRIDNHHIESKFLKDKIKYLKNRNLYYLKKFFLPNILNKKNKY